MSKMDFSVKWLAFLQDVTQATRPLHTVSVISHLHQRFMNNLHQGEKAEETLQTRFYKPVLEV
jgi:hypothetical protein